MPISLQSMRHALFLPNLLLTLLFSLSVALPTAFGIETSADGFPARPCKRVFDPAAPTIHPSMISKADPEKTLQLEDIGVKNQRRYGSCWITSDLANWERASQFRFGRRVPLSENYLIAASLSLRVREGLYFGEEITQGGMAEVAEWMAREIGLIPESVWKPKIDLRDKFVGDEIVGYLNFEIAKFQIQLKEMRAKKVSEKKAWEVLQSTLDRLNQYLEDRIGRPPARFQYAGKKYTPKSFTAAIESETGPTTLITFSPKERRLAGEKDTIDVISEKNAFFHLYPEAAHRLPGAEAFRDIPRSRMLMAYKHENIAAAQNIEFKRANLDAIQAVIIDELREGRSVLLGTYVVKPFYNREGGIFSLAAFGAKPADARLGKNSGGHAILITGAYFDSKGSLLGFRIQNSWGPKNGDLGYYDMDLDYFETCMVDITVKRPLER